MGTFLENNFLNIHPKIHHYRTDIIGLSLGRSKGNIVVVILGKGLVCTIIATDGMTIG